MTNSRIGVNMSDQFKASQEKVKNLKKRPSDSELLQLYALFKQATEGDAKGDRPGMLKIKERAKWDAWNKLKGKGGNESENAYCNLVGELVLKYGV